MFTRHIAGFAVLVCAGLCVSLHADNPPYDGYGNNTTNPEWGAAGTHLMRLCPPNYADGMNQPSGFTRPNPRTISNTISAQEGTIPSRRVLTTMLIFWGQFLDHDIDLTPGHMHPVEFMRRTSRCPQGDPVRSTRTSTRGPRIIPLTPLAPRRPRHGDTPENPRAAGERDHGAGSMRSNVYGSTYISGPSS